MELYFCTEKLGSCHFFKISRFTISRFDIIIVGSGFSSIFFMKKWLEKRPSSRVLLLERGERKDINWQIKNRRNNENVFDEDNVIKRTGIDSQHWPHTIGFGGGSNCWGANAMRMHPTGFKLKSLYGVGEDWPISYSDIEEYYTAVETIMEISGDHDSAGLFPRSAPFPQPRHRFNDVSLKFKTAYPDKFFAMPQARARMATSKRNTCCANLACRQCPANAKFTILNDLGDAFVKDNVTFLEGARVHQVLTQGGVAQGVMFKVQDVEHTVFSDVVVLGANAIYNPDLLINSSINQGPVGMGLTEQSGVTVTAYIGGDLDSTNGSSPFGGVGYNFLVGPHLAECAGGFYEIGNGILLRPHATKWRSIITITALFDDLRSNSNYVSQSNDRSERPLVHFEGWSEYSNKGRTYFKNSIHKLLSPFEIEELSIDVLSQGGFGHIQGTTVMGSDPSKSVVDAGLVHHFYRNLFILGSGAFPTAGGVNPTLTLSALALRAADKS